MNPDEIAPERTTERRTVVGERTEREDRPWTGPGHLARLELNQTWPSYLTGVLLAFLVGLFSLSLLWAAPDPTGDGSSPTTPLLDSAFVFLLANLGINWTSTRWLYLHTDPFAPRLSFLRALPISVRDLILGRLTLVLIATAVTSLAFFVPSYALFPALRSEIPAAQYLWFAFFWIGYALFSAGILLYLEMGTKGISALLVCIVWAGLLLMIVVIAQLLSVPLVRESLELVGLYGPLVAIPVLVTGAGGLLLWCRLLEHRMKTRELAS